MKAWHICNNLKVVYDSVSYYLGFYVKSRQKLIAPDLVVEIEAEMKTSM